MVEKQGKWEIGVTSGWYSIAKSQELHGITQKISSAATTGANYIQVDFENTSEFVEPDVIDRIRQTVEDLKISWGAHGEIGGSMAWEGAIEVIWKQSHRRLHQYLDAVYDYFFQGKNQREGNDYKKHKPEYINFHASNLHPIGLLVERYRYQGQIMMDFKGRENWKDLITTSQELKYWFCDTLLRHIFATETGRGYMNDNQLNYEVASDMIGIGSENFERRVESEFQKSKTGKQEDDARLRNEIINIVEEQMKKERENEIRSFLEKYNQKDKSTREKFNDHMFEMWLKFSQLRQSKGAIIREEFAYAIVAKYLEFKKDDKDEPLWNLYFHGKSMEDLEKEWSTEGRTVKLWDDERGTVSLMPRVVAMVASRYIIGHFREPQLPEFIQDRKLEFQKSTENEGKQFDPFYEKKAIEKINILKVFITFETPDILENQTEGLQRIIHAKDIHKLIKAFNNPYILGWIDVEHYLHNGLDPIREFKDCDDDAFESFIGLHVGSPKTYAPGHDLIDVGSEAQRWIYVYAYNMMKKGFGVGKNKGIIIFERGAGRGGGNMPIHYIGNSVTSIRLIVAELEKDTPPEKLPMEFFGVSPDGFHSEQKQIEIMHEHYWDPLKGMLAVPEEEYTFLSRTAFDKGKRGDEFKRAELR